MANAQERAELHKTIWKIANDLRGSVDGWEFKAYVLGSIFYRFISENICDYIHASRTWRLDSTRDRSNMNTIEIKY